MIKTSLGLLLTMLFLALAMIHVYWALGGRSGSLAAVPSIDERPLFSPSPLASLLVAVALVVAATVIAGAMGWLGRQVPPTVYRNLTFAISFVFFVRAIGDFRYVGLFKSAGDSAFRYWDSTLYSPLCLVIAVAAFLVGRWTR